MTGKESFFKLVEEGRKGNNVGMPIGSPKMEKFMDGYLGGTSYLIGGASGSGKSTKALYSFIYCPLIAFLENPEFSNRDPHWLIFCLEMTKEQLYAKLVSMYIFDKYHKQLRFKQIFSRGKDCILSDEDFELLKNCSDFIDVLDERLACVTGGLNEAKYVKIVKEYLSRFGTWNDDGSYTPDNPQQIIGGKIDHCSLVQASNGRTKKEEMDAISRDSVFFRNTTKIFSPIHISQFNRGSRSDERLKQSAQEPNEADFKDSGAIYEDAQVVFAIYSPHKYRQSSFHKYKIQNALEQCFIAEYCLKTRFGTSDFWVPFGFYGDCSHYHELPRPDEIYDYEKYKDPYWTLENNNLKDENNDEKDVENKPKFKFNL